MSDTRPEAAQRLRSKLLAVARRLLGRRAGAEDAVQEAYLRLHAHGETVADPEAWLVRATTRLCLDRLRRLRREGDAELPDDLPAAAGPDPAELADALAAAFRVLLGTLSPAERAAFVLREAFGYDYAEIGGLLGTSAVNARQIASRARRRLAGPDRPATDPGGPGRLPDGLLSAWRAGDLPAVERLLLPRPAGPQCRAGGTFLLAA